MEVAHKPHMDRLAGKGLCGMVKTTPDRMSPGSDICNLSVMGYAPEQNYTGRSPLEAVSIGIAFGPNDLATRCNFVTLSDEAAFAEKRLVDYCADDISTEEADELIGFLNRQLLEGSGHQLYCGVSYRHCLLSPDYQAPMGATPPHDITGQRVADYLPENADFLALMEKAAALLNDHPVNQKRRAEGKQPANGIWLWGSGYKKELEPFRQKTGLKGCVISAVDLIKGIGRLAGMEVCRVAGATGYIDTNFRGKAEAAIQAMKDGYDYIYLHVEAPDECGHRFEVDNKVKAIELIDEHILGPLLEALEAYDDYRILIMPDHATPLRTRTHAANPVPLVLYKKGMDLQTGITCFSEETARNTNFIVQKGCKLLELLTNGAHCEE